ncbi:unnamed protein product [Agarophyton chilense]|eukprot:gb/GEZJ01005091.1/.p1 GENE.gb/GEZJ01005091.1/~~gb/GEZJ01005091.1/.p1  ORF type:complete len:175 (+),score=25.53 gb/GEZJ01005091.1/:515-1039(+)
MNLKTPDSTSGNRESRVSVFKIQASGVPRERRDVTKTIDLKLLLANRKLNGDVEDEKREKIHMARCFLDDTSPHNHLRTIPAKAGLFQNPHRPFKFVSFDILHAVEHGKLRQLSNWCFKTFDSAPAYHFLPRTKPLAIADQQMQDIPKLARIGRVVSFKSAVEEKQEAGVSGKL